MGPHPGRRRAGREGAAGAGARPAGRLAPGLGLALALLAACAPEEPSPADGPAPAPAPAVGATAPPADEPLAFGVRGRWDDASDLTFRIEEARSEAERGPLDAAALGRIVAAAAEGWRLPGRVAFRPAREGELADVSIGWRRGAHERDCRPFGVDRSVAHAGPVGPDTFVHLDATRRWREAGGDGPSLRVALAHELGHVLGLDHVGRSDALLFPDPDGTNALPTPSDLAGLHSLYGGGEPPPGSLAVVSGDAVEPALVLHGVASPGLVHWTLFDADADGADELVTWRTDAAGQGAVELFRFGPGPVLERTVGPQPGVTSVRATTLLGEDEDGVPCLLALFPDGRFGLSVFAPDGRLEPRAGVALRFTAGGVELTDADGDGVLEGDPAGLAPPHRTTGDLDGDGVPERVAPTG